MRQLEITVRIVDEEGKAVSSAGTLTKTFKAIEANELQDKQGLDQLEQEMVTIKDNLLPQILKWRIEELDAELARARKHVTQDCHVNFDGKKN